MGHSEIFNKESCKILKMLGIKKITPKTNRFTKFLKEEKYFLAILLLSVALHFTFLEEFPGLHFDEARHANEAINIIGGESNPLIQQVNYAGNFAYYFIALEFLLTGSHSIFSLRFMGVLFNILAAIFLYISLREIDKKSALFSCAIFLFLPFNYIFFRIAWPEFTLIPFFFFACLFFFTKYQKTKQKRYLVIFALFFFTALQLKLIFFIYFPYFLIYLLVRNRKAINLPMIFLIAFIFIIAMHPLLLHNFVRNDVPIKSDISLKNFELLPRNYINFYKEIGGVLSGKLAFIRVGLSRPFSLEAAYSLLFFMSVIYLVFSRYKIKYLAASSLIFAPFFLTFATNFHFALRYYIPFVPIAAITLGFFIARIVRFAEKRKVLCSGFVVLSIIAFVNTAVSLYNVGLLEKEKVGFESFQIGSHTEATDHFIPTFKQISKYISAYDHIYFYESFGGDPRSVFIFETGKQVDLFTPDSKIAPGAGDIYFSIEQEGRNEVSDKLKKARMPFKTISYKNGYGDTILKMYVIRGGNDD